MPSSKRPQFSSPLTSNYLKDHGGSGDDDHDNENHKKKTRSSSKKKRDVNQEREELKRARLEAEEEEEQRLTNLLFGGNDSSGGGAIGGGVGVDFIDGSAWHDDDDDDEGDDNNAALFTIDRDAVDASDVEGDGSEDDEDSNVENGHQLQRSSSDSDDDESTEQKSNAAAWVDDDDENITISLTKADRIKKLRKTMSEDIIEGTTYEQRLRDRFQATASATSRIDWATVPGDDDDGSEGDSGEGSSRSSSGEEDDSDDDDNMEHANKASQLLSSSAPLLASGTKLQANILSVVRCPDANAGHYSNSAVRSVQFHPGSDEDEPLMLTAGMDKTLRFFKTNGTEGSQKIHGIHFPNLPIHHAEFLGDTGSVVVSGRRPFFYIYDMIAGKIDKVPRIQGRKEKSLEKFTTSPDGSLIAFIGNDGYIILVEAKSRMWVADFKMNGSCRAVTFSPDGDFIIASGSDGDVYRFDIRSKRCIDRFQNQDGTITSFLSQSSRFTAVGAESGVVNLYNNDLTSSSLSFKRAQARTPIKSIMNLYTSIDNMRFNPNGDILAISSQREKDSLKLVHMPTQTVFSNWPTSKTPLAYVYSLDFSPGSKFMAIGNDKGKCLLYKLSHYDT